MFNQNLSLLENRSLFLRNIMVYQVFSMLIDVYQLFRYVPNVIDKKMMIEQKHHVSNKKVQTQDLSPGPQNF